MEDMNDNDVVVIIQHNQTRLCFQLETLAIWFLTHATTWGTLPRNPVTGTLIPRDVYVEVMNSAREHITGFSDTVWSHISDLPEERQSFITGEPPPSPPPRRRRSRRRDILPPPESLTIPAEYSPRQRRRRARRRSISPQYRGSKRERIHRARVGP